jgi:hypothetical protein
MKLTDDNGVKSVIHRLELAFEEPYYWAEDVARFVAELIKKFDSDIILTQEDFKEFLVSELGLDPDMKYDINESFWEEGYWNERSSGLD